MRLWTSRFGNRGLEQADIVGVRTTLYPPKFPVRFVVASLLALAPTKAMWNLQGEVFTEAYRKKLEETGVDRLHETFARISAEHDGRDLVLLCFEKRPEDCHRGDFARWWLEQTGEVVEEWPDSGSLLPAGKKRPPKGGVTKPARSQAAEPAQGALKLEGELLRALLGLALDLERDGCDFYTRYARKEMTAAQLREAVVQTMTMRAVA